jgi:uncharacterized protein (DUF1501 family)
MDRRHFLQLALSTTVSTVSWRLWAAAKTSVDGRFVLVFLRGAYDALSAVVPYAEPFYHASRPTIALARPDANAPEASIQLDGRWALHPALEDALWPLWQAGQLAFVPFAGTGFISRSHFQAQDWMEFGQAPGIRPDSGSGFLNRLLVELGADRQRAGGVSFTQTLAPSLRGGVQVANSPLSLPRGQRATPDHERLLQTMYLGHPLEAQVRDGLGLRREISEELREEMQASSRQALPAGSFAVEAGRMGRILRDHPEYKVAFADVGGWDTHAAQGAARGALANRLRELGEGLSALSESLGEEWSKTVVVVISEFGRTFRENGSRGTDHGHGTTLWVMGGGVRGGTIRGEQGELDERGLHQDRDVPVLNEYRDVVAGLFERQFSLPKAAVSRVFPACVVRDLALL